MKPLKAVMYFYPLVHPLAFLAGMVMTAWAGGWTEVETNVQRLTMVGRGIYCVSALAAFAVLVCLEYLLRMGWRKMAFRQFAEKYVKCQAPFLLLAPLIVWMLFGEMEGNIVGFVVLPAFFALSLIASLYHRRLWDKEFARE